MTSEFKTDKSVKALECIKEVWPLTKDYYQKSWKAREEGKKVAYCASAFFPVELLWVMDIYPVIPENFSAACAAKQISPQAMEAAESVGWHEELCSYFKCYMGYCSNPDNLPRPPGGGLAPPDMILGIENNCMVQVKWMRVLERFYQLPCHVMHFPVIPDRMRGAKCGEAKIDDHFIALAVAQLKEFVRFLEEQTGKKLDIDRLKEAVRLDHLRSTFFEQACNYRRTLPCPAGAEDFSSTIGINLIFAGTQIAADFAEKLSRELGERVKAVQSPVPEEKYRLMFSFIPPWYTLGFYNYFRKFNAVFAYEYYNTFHIVRPLDPEKPFESLALKYMDFYTHWNFRRQADIQVRDAISHRIDGALLGLNKSCKISSLQNRYISERLEKDVGIPSLLFEYDHSDPRIYSDDEVKRKVDDFIEVVAASKEEREQKLSSLIQALEKG